MFATGANGGKAELALVPYFDAGRQSVVNGIGGSAGTVTYCVCGAGRSTSIPDAPDIMFRNLADRWRKETRLLSNIAKRSINPAYKGIICMGRTAIPLILKDLMDNGPDDWFWALTSITGENPITKQIAGNMNAMTEAWIKWGIQAGYLSDSCQRTRNASKHSAQLDTE